MRRLLLVVLSFSFFGCEPGFYQRPDYTIWEIPQDATMLPLPTTSLVTTGPFAFYSAGSARLKRRDDGVIQARVTGEEVYYIGSNFGGTMPVFVPIVLCYDFAAGQPTLSGYQAGGMGDVSGCPVIDSPEPKRDALPPELTVLTGTVIDGAQGSGFDGQWKHITVPEVDGAAAFFGSASTSMTLEGEFPDFVGPKDLYERSLVMRATLKNGVPDQVALDFAPDAKDMLTEVTANPGAAGMDYFWRARDESIFRIANDSVPLKLQYLGQGAFNLKNEANVQAAVGLTLGNLVVGDQWTALFATNGKRLNLSIRTRKVATAEFKAVRPFMPTLASTPNPRAVRVCFNEQLDVATLRPEAFTFTPPVPVVSLFASPSRLCVFIGTQPREARAFAVTVKDLKSVFGSALPVHGIGFSINGDRERIIDLANDVFRGDVDAAGQRVVQVETIAPTSSGGVVSISRDFGDRVLSSTGRELAFMQPVEKLGQGPLRSAPDVLGRGLWVLSELDAGVTRVVRYDDLPAERLDFAGDNLSLVPLGDGSAIVNSTAGATARIAQGVSSPLPAAFVGKRVSGFVHGSADVLTSTTNMSTGTELVERRSVTDGAVVASYGPVIVAATQLMDPYLCAGFLYRALPDGGVRELTEGAPNLHIDCTDLTKAPDGTIYVTASERLFQLRDGGMTQVSWRVVSEPDSPVVVKPRFVSNGVFFTGQTAAIGQSQGRSSLHFASHAQWNLLTDGGAR